MKITKSHYDFWCQHKSKVSWYPSASMLIKRSKSTLSTDNTISIHRLVPLDHKFDKNFTAQNLLTNIKWHRDRKEDLAVYLYERINNPDTIMNPKRVSAFCRKWLLRIVQGRISSGKIPPSHIENLKVVLTVLDELKKIEAKYNRVMGDAR